MTFFECCYKCAPPKRYPGCHASCRGYLDARKRYDEAVALQKKERAREDMFRELRKLRPRRRDT